MTHETSPEWATPRLEAAITAALCGEWGRCNIAPPVTVINLMRERYNDRRFVAGSELMRFDQPTVREMWEAERFRIMSGSER